MHGRIFALLGYELVEGRLEEGRIQEFRRINYAPQNIGIRERLRRLESLRACFSVGRRVSACLFLRKPRNQRVVHFPPCNSAPSVVRAYPNPRDFRTD